MFDSIIPGAELVRGACEAWGGGREGKGHEGKRGWIPGGGERGGGPAQDRRRDYGLTVPVIKLRLRTPGRGTV